MAKNKPAEKAGKRDERNKEVEIAGAGFLLPGPLTWLTVAYYAAVGEEQAQKLGHDTWKVKGYNDMAQELVRLSKERLNSNKKQAKLEFRDRRWFATTCRPHSKAGRSMTCSK